MSAITSSSQDSPSSENLNVESFITTTVCEIVFEEDRLGPVADHRSCTDDDNIEKWLQLLTCTMPCKDASHKFVFELKGRKACYIIRITNIVSMVIESPESINIPDEINIEIASELNCFLISGKPYQNMTRNALVKEIESEILSLSKQEKFSKSELMQAKEVSVSFNARPAIMLK